jgi:hypothetical protein
MGIFVGIAPKLLDRLGTTDAQPTSQPSAALVYHIVKQDDKLDLLLAPDAWRAHQTALGICWICGDTLPLGARFCISCRAETGPATSDTDRLYVPPALGETERL